MKYVVAHLDVVSENLLPQPVRQAAPLFVDGEAAEIPEKESEQVEHRRGLEDHGMAAGLDFFWLHTPQGLPRRPVGQGFGVELERQRRSLLRPSGASRAQHGHGKLRERFFVKGGEPARVEQPEGRGAARKNSRRRELVLFRAPDRCFYGFGPCFGR